MQMPRLSKATKRDAAHIGDASRELWQDMKSPLFWIGVIVIVFFLVAPFVLSEGELPW